MKRTFFCFSEEKSLFHYYYGCALLWGCCSSASQTRQEIEISAVPPETASHVSHRTTPKMKFTLVLKTKQFWWYSWTSWHFRKDLEGLGSTFTILWKSRPRDELTNPLWWNRTKQILTERAEYLLLCTEFWKRLYSEPIFVNLYLDNAKLYLMGSILNLHYSLRKSSQVVLMMSANWFY